mmetsp:Transcript_10518/g.42898  ORF Transcript_10518/g.42898 Transcript_10518/m.42898 type:complete len:879 (-) Transcript_10518:1537-4173(-)
MADVAGLRVLGAEDVLNDLQGTLEVLHGHLVGLDLLQQPSQLQVQRADGDVAAASQHEEDEERALVHEQRMQRLLRSLQVLRQGQVCNGNVVAVEAAHALEDDDAVLHVVDGLRDVACAGEDVGELEEAHGRRVVQRSRGVVAARQSLRVQVVGAVQVTLGHEVVCCIHAPQRSRCGWERGLDEGIDSCDVVGGDRAGEVEGTRAEADASLETEGAEQRDAVLLSLLVELLEDGLLRLVVGGGEGDQLAVERGLGELLHLEGVHVLNRLGLLQRREDEATYALHEAGSEVSRRGGLLVGGHLANERVEEMLRSPHQHLLEHEHTVEGGNRREDGSQVAHVAEVDAARLQEEPHLLAVDRQLRGENVVRRRGDCDVLEVGGQLVVLRLQGLHRFVALGDLSLEPHCTIVGVERGHDERRDVHLQLVLLCARLLLCLLALFRTRGTRLLVLGLLLLLLVLRLSLALLSGSLRGSLLRGGLLCALLRHLLAGGHDVSTLAVVHIPAEELRPVDGPPLAPGRVWARGTVQVHGVDPAVGSADALGRDGGCHRVRGAVAGLVLLRRQEEALGGLLHEAMHLLVPRQLLAVCQRAIHHRSRVGLEDAGHNGLGEHAHSLQCDERGHDRVQAVDGGVIVDARAEDVVVRQLVRKLVVTVLRQDTVFVLVLVAVGVGVKDVVVHEEVERRRILRVRRQQVLVDDLQGTLGGSIDEFCLHRVEAAVAGHCVHHAGVLHVAERLHLRVPVASHVRWRTKRLRHAVRAVGNLVTEVEERAWLANLRLLAEGSEPRLLAVGGGNTVEEVRAELAHGGALVEDLLEGLLEGRVDRADERRQLREGLRSGVGVELALGALVQEKARRRASHLVGLTVARLHAEVGKVTLSSP